MSDFASLLSSFKQDASAASAASSSRSIQQNLQSRKRPLSVSATTAAAAPKRQSIPHFPSVHCHNRKENDFELTFLCIGAQKGGTTWLHKLLQKCDDISLPQEQKEVHFWDWHHRKGFEWYIRQFEYHSQKASSPPLHYGEITPCYVVLPEPTIAELYKCFPNLKIIFVARDLVDRAWSAMIMELRDQTMGLNAGEFAKGVTGNNHSNNSNNSSANKTSKLSAAQQRRLEQQSSPSSQPDSYFLDRLRDATHDSRSNYAKHLRNWYKHYPSSSILLIDYSEIESNPRNVLLKVVMHIGVDEERAKQFIASLNDDEVGQRVNVATSVSGASSSSTSSHQLLTQRPLLKKQLERYLQPYARDFNDLLKEKGYNDWRLDDYSLKKEKL